MTEQSSVWPLPSSSDTEDEDSSQVKSVESPSSGTTPYPVRGGALSQPSLQVQRYSCSYCDKTFPSKKKEMKHLKAKTFKIDEIGGDLSVFIKKESDGNTSCFCGFKHKLRSQVIAHAHKHVPELGFSCEI